MQLSDIDVTDRDVFTRGVPHDWFTYLRAHEPVFRHPEPDGAGFWVLSKHADVRAVSRDPGTYGSDPTGYQEDLEGALSGLDAKVLLGMDPPEHTKYRHLVNRGFTPRMIGALQDHIREITVRILERAIGMGVCDFVVDIAAQLPLEVIAELIGVPIQDRHKLFEWTNALVGVGTIRNTSPVTTLVSVLRSSSAPIWRCFRTPERCANSAEQSHATTS